jgi:hypothetical protein
LKVGVTWIRSVAGKMFAAFGIWGARAVTAARID